MGAPQAGVAAEALVGWNSTVVANYIIYGLVRLQSDLPVHRTVLFVEKAAATW